MGLLLSPFEVTQGMNMVNVIENAFDNDPSQIPSINMILEHVLALERTPHH